MGEDRTADQRSAHRGKQNRDVEQSSHSVHSSRSPIARRVLPGGSEPDPRFTLANERTFLAWIRTSLAFLAGGIALETLGEEVFPSPAHGLLAVLIIAIAFLISIGAAVRWWRVENSLRRSRPLSLPLIIPLLSLGGAVAACLILAAVFAS